MRLSVVYRSSLLLQHMQCSLPVLQRLYHSPASSPPTQKSGSGAAARAQLSASPSPSPALAFPPDPQTPEQGDDVLRFFCVELGMGEKPLCQWRQRLQERVRQRWGTAEDGPDSSNNSTTSREWTPVRGTSSTRWFRPRPQDTAVVRSALHDLKFLVSPLLILSPPPHERANAHGAPLPPTTTTTASAGVVGDVSLSRLLLQRPTTHGACSRWYATQPIPAGMFLMGIPTEAVFFAHPPPAADPLLAFFMQVEELVAQLVEAAATEDAAHHGYVSYLCDSVVPCANLPFLSPTELQASFAQEEATADTVTPALDSPALSLLKFFHTDMGGEPLSDFLRTRLTKEEYAWWVSLVLAHRAGASSLLPMVDKLNHSPLPNCYYTMATQDSLCGLDVLDNLLAGVPGELLYQPYVHVFAIRDIAAGEEVTLCYASAAAAAYKPAGHHPPPRPASLPSLTGRREGDGGDARTRASEAVRGGREPRSPTVTAAAGSDMEDVLHGLFPSVVSGGGIGELAQLQHPGRQEVDTAEGRATWRLQWGFVPPCDAVYSAKDLVEVAGLVAERRVDTRRLLFPPPPPPTGA